MSYTPTEWQTGDTITEQKLNNMEGGIDAAANPFIVTLTPTALDFSGTMDKTVAEINAAYEAGQRIVFRVLTSANSYVDIPMSYAGRATTFQYPDFGAEIIQYANNLMILAHTGDTDDGTAQTYNTIIYSLTSSSAIFQITWERDSDLGINRLILHASFDEVLAAYRAGSLVTATARFEDADYSEYRFCRFYLCAVDDYNSTVTFYGHDPTAGGYDPIGFYSDASGETMSTDGGYVPT